MRLGAEQRAAALANRPGARLVRLPGGNCGAVWFEPDQPRRLRWRGQLLKAVRRPDDPSRPIARFLETDWEVWWSGGEVGGATRRAVVEALGAEAAT